MKEMKKIILALVIILVISGFSSAVSAIYEDWDYKRFIHLTENSGSNLTNFQVPINLTTALYDNTGLVGSWHFSEGSGLRAADSSGNNNDGTLTNGPVWTTGKFGSGLQFDGSNDYMQVSDSPELNPTSQITVAAWYKPTNSWVGMGNDPIVGKPFTSHSDPYYQYHLGVTGDQYSSSQRSFSFYVATTNGGFSTGVTGVWTLNNWYYVVGTYNGSTVNLYLNGQLISSDPASGDLRTFPTGVFFGKYGNINAYLPGITDEVSIYNRALSLPEIQDRFNATKARLDLGDLRFTANTPSYKLPLTISGQTEDLSDYQVPIIITDPTIISHIVKDDAGDLRFFEIETTEPYNESVGKLSYWVEEFDAGTNTFKVWVKVNLTANTPKTIYMYYGNSEAGSLSVIGNVFPLSYSAEYGEYPNDVSTNFPQWGNPTGGIITLSGGILSLTDNDVVTHRPKYAILNQMTSEFIIEALFSATSPSDKDRQTGLRYGSGTNTMDTLTLGTNHIGIFWSGLSDISTNYCDDTFRHIKLTRYGNSVSVDVDGVNKISGSLSTSSDDNIIMFGEGILSVGATGHSEWKYFFVRKYSSVEPTTSVGAESLLTRNEMQAPHWLENDNKVWVKVPIIPANNSTDIFMYYGNSSATYNNSQGGNNTFEFFDDFEDGTYTDKWTVISGTWSESGGVISQTDSTQANWDIQAQMSDIQDAVIETKVKWTGGSTSYGSSSIKLRDDPQLNFRYDGGVKQTELRIDAIGSLHEASFSWNSNTWYRLKLITFGNYASGYIDDVLMHNNIDLGSSSTGKARLNNYFAAGQWDDARVRKYASSEPTLTLGPEQQNFGGTQPTYSNFTGSETTDFSIADVSNVTNLTLAVTGSGKIKFPQNHSINAVDEDYNTHVKIENSLIFVNSSALDNTFNNSATLTFEGVNCNAPYVYYSEIVSTRTAILAENNLCLSPRCSNIQCTGSILTVDVTHFSGYAVNGTANLTIDADDPKYPLEVVTFTAEYMNSTGFITGATCNISFTDGSHIMDEQADHYNYTRTFASEQIAEYNVTCSKSGENTVFATDTAVIGDIAIPEFSIITLGLGLVVVLGGLIVIRKKR